MLMYGSLSMNSLVSNCKLMFQCNRPCELSQAHGRSTLKNLVEAWNKMLQREVEHTPTTKTDAAAAFLASLEEPKLTSLVEAAKKPPIEILPPGMSSLSASISIQKKPAPGTQSGQQQPSKPLALEASQQQQNKPLALEAPPSTSAPAEGSAAPPAEGSAAPQAEGSSPPPAEAGEANLGDKAPIQSSRSNSDLAASASEESTLATSATGAAVSEVPTQVPDLQAKPEEANIPATLPMSDQLA